jgi:DNA repair exonuclease SbcCD nuclease subunit
MRLLILSDLHLEFWKDTAPVSDLAVARPDAVILAGDIDKGAKAIAWAAHSFLGLPVLYVHGNHEAYGQDLEGTQRDIAVACVVHPNVHFLNCSEHVIGNVRFLGCTLWTDFCLFGDDQRQAAMHVAEIVVADYKRVLVSERDYRRLRPTDTAQFHAQQNAWLQQKLVEPFAGKTVVITHMAPSMQSVSAQYSEDLVSAAFTSQMDDLVAQADLWVHGHMHESFNYQIGKCKVICNPRGYPLMSGPENAVFDPNFIVEVA